MTQEGRKAGAPKENKNAEKWTLEEAGNFLEKSLILSQSERFDFLGEIAKELGSYIDIYDYLIEKFPELKHYKTHIMRNCEANCFSNGKKGNINTALAIVNLKSNHKWTDRVATDHSTLGEKITPPIEWVKTPNEDI